MLGVEEFYYWQEYPRWPREEGLARTQLRAKARLKEYSRIHGKPQIPIGDNLALAWQTREEAVSIDREKLALEVEGPVETATRSRPTCRRLESRRGSRSRR